MWLNLLVMKYIYGQFGPKSPGPTENNKQEIWVKPTSQCLGNAGNLGKTGAVRRVNTPMGSSLHFLPLFDATLLGPMPIYPRSTYLGNFWPC